MEESYLKPVNYIDNNPVKPGEILYLTAEGTAVKSDANSCAQIRLNKDGYIQILPLDNPVQVSITDTNGNTLQLAPDPANPNQWVDLPPGYTLAAGNTKVDLKTEYKPAADGSKVTSSTIYDPDSEPNNPAILSTTEYTDGIAHIKREPNYQNESMDLLTEFDPATKNWIRYQFAQKDSQGKEQVIASVESIDDAHNQIIVKIFGTTLIKSLHSRMPDHGSTAFVLNSRPDPVRPGELEYYIEEMDVYDSNLNEKMKIKTTNGDITFKHDPRTGKITGIEGGEFKYKGAKIPPDTLAKMMTENRPLNRGLQQFMRQIEKPHK